MYLTKLENLKEIGNFPDRYQLLKLNQGQLSNLNRFIIPSKIEAAIKSHLTKQTNKPRVRQFWHRILSDLQRRDNTNIPKNYYTK